MLKDKKILFTIFHQVEKLFDSIKKQLFVEEWIREKTELFFAVRTLGSGADEIAFCRQGRNSERRSLEKGENVVRIAVGQYVKEEWGDRKFLIGSLFRSVSEGILKDIFCICVSPCIDKNCGKLLLEQTFQTLLRTVEDWLYDCASEEWKEDDCLKIDNFHHVVQCILQEAAEKTCEYLEGFYFPIKISYINSLAGEYYEKAECKSNLLFLSNMENCDIDSKVLEYDFRTDNGKSEIAFVPENFRWIRKLTQMAQDSLCLVFQNSREERAYEVVGIGRKKKEKNMGIPYFWAEIKRHMQWDLYLGSDYIFSFRNGNYKITMVMPNEYVEEKCRMIFGSKDSYGAVTRCILASREQTHGTMLVVLYGKDAEAEVKRLSNVKAGMQDANPTVRENVIDKLNAIDGSVIMGTNGTVYGIGMILDGDSSAEGNPARGARYNSARKYQKYLERKKMPGLIFIVSEDGSVEILTSEKNNWKNEITSKTE